VLRGERIGMDCQGKEILSLLTVDAIAWGVKERRNDFRQEHRSHPGFAPFPLLFQFQIIRDFVDFALPCCFYCPRLVFAARMIWKWNYAPCFRYSARFPKVIYFQSGRSPSRMRLT
jgi:hypothetical protein